MGRASPGKQALLRTLCLSCLRTEITAHVLGSEANSHSWHAMWESFPQYPDLLCLLAIYFQIQENHYFNTYYYYVLDRPKC